MAESSKENTCSKENTLSKTKHDVEQYCLKALTKIFDEKLPKKEDDGKRVADKKDDYEWRELPSHMKAKECMIICSGGDCFAPSVDIGVPKLCDNSMADDELQLLRKELDVVQDKMREDANYHLIQVCLDFPGAQKSKDYYLERMKQLMTGCKQPGGKYHPVWWASPFPFWERGGPARLAQSLAVTAIVK